LDLGDVSTLLPADDSTFGFDNIAEALGFSSVLLERYVTVGGRLSALAVGSREVAPGSDTFVLRQDYSQDQHVDGQPFGTVGGMLHRFTFPLDAEYQISASLMRTNVDVPRGLEDPRQVEFTLDAARILATLSHRAYRGQESPADEERLLAFYRAGRKEKDFDTGIERALHRILASPKFLLRVEPAPAEVAAGAVYRLSDFELASRLSFFLWSSIPDDELLKVAAERRLSN